MGISCFHLLEIGNYPSMVGHLTTVMLNLILPQILEVLINFGIFCNLSELDYTIRNAQVAPNLLLSCCLAVIKLISGCVRIASSGLVITSLLRVVNRIDAS